MNAEGITYLDAIDKLEELRLIMKRVHKKVMFHIEKQVFRL